MRSPYVILLDDRLTLFHKTFNKNKKSLYAAYIALRCIDPTDFPPTDCLPMFDRRQILSYIALAITCDLSLTNIMGVLLNIVLRHIIYQTSFCLDYENNLILVSTQAGCYPSINNYFINIGFSFYLFIQT